MTARPAWTPRALHWTLRIGCAMCFIGHGAFGIRVKAIEPGFVQAIGMSFQRNWDWTKLIFRTLAGLYHMVSFVVRATGLAPEPYAPRFPTATT